MEYRAVMRQILELLKVQSHLIRGLYALSSMVMFSPMATPEQSWPLMFQSLGACLPQAAKMEFKARAVVLHHTTTAQYFQYLTKQINRLN